MLDSRRQKYFADVARATAGLSHAKKLQVGAVAVRDGRAICTGYNGTPAGEDNRCEDEVFDDVLGPRLVTKDNVEHAERNLIYFAAKKGIALEGASLFVTHSPCMQCARAILNVGIRELYYETPFSDEEGLRFLQERINVVRVGP
jgi:dCMP deaminase